MPAVALTDSANLFGALEFAQGCAGKGVQPIMGCQLFLSRAASDDRPEAAGSRPTRWWPWPWMRTAWITYSACRRAASWPRRLRAARLKLYVARGTCRTG